MRSRTTLALIVLFLTAPASPPALADSFIPGNVDVSGRWVLQGGRGDVPICRGSVVAPCLQNQHVMAHRDWFELRVAKREDGKDDVEVGALETPFGGSSDAVRIRYEGVYHHHHGYGSRENVQEGFAIRRRFIDSVTYDLKGELIHDRARRAVSLALIGSLAPGTMPSFLHGIGMRLSTESGSLLVIDRRTLFADAEGSTIVLAAIIGFGDHAGAGGLFPPGASDRLADPWPQVTSQGTYLHNLVFERIGGPSLAGRISGAVAPRLVVGAAVDRATVQLYRLFGGAVAPQGAGESDSAFRERLIGDAAPYRSAIVDDAATFAFDNLPQTWERADSAGRPLSSPILYVVEVEHAESDADEAVFGTPIVYYRPRLEINVPPIADVLIELDALPEIGAKRALLEALEAMSDRYRQAEAGVGAYLESLEDAAPTGARLEGLRRGILAEQAVRVAAEESRIALRLFLDGLGEFLAGIVKDAWKPSTDSLRNAKEWDKRLRANEAGVVDFFARNGIAESDARQTLGEFRRQAGRSKLAGLIKRSLKLVDAAAQRAARSLGLDPGAAGTVMGYATVAADIVLSGVESGTYKGGVKAVVQRILKEIEALAPLLFDGQLPDFLPGVDEGGLDAFPSYTELTAPNLSLAAERMQAWAVDDPTAYSQDAGRVHDVLRTILDESATTQQWFLMSRAIAKTADQVQDGAALADGLGIKKAKLVGVAAQVVKHAAGAIAWVEPALSVFGRWPGLLDEAIESAIGAPPDGGAGAGAGSPARGASNPYLTQSLQDCRATLDRSLDALEDHLAAGDVAGVFAAIRGADASGGGLFANAAAWERAADAAATQLLAADIASSDDELADWLSRSGIDANALVADVNERLLDLIGGLAIGDIAGTDDPLFAASRARLLSSVDALRARAADVERLHAALAPRLAAATTTSASAASSSRRIRDPRRSVRRPGQDRRLEGEDPEGPPRPRAARLRGRPPRALAAPGLDDALRSRRPRQGQDGARQAQRSRP